MNPVNLRDGLLSPTMWQYYGSQQTLMNWSTTALGLSLILMSGQSSLLAQVKTPTRVRIASSIASGITLHVVLPRDIGVPGDVVLDMVVSKQGGVLGVRGVSGDKQLQRISKTAVMKWRFMPYYLNGESVEFATEVALHFDGNKGNAQLLPPKPMKIPPPPLPDISSPKSP